MRAVKRNSAIPLMVLSGSSRQVARLNVHPVHPHTWLLALSDHRNGDAARVLFLKGNWRHGESSMLSLPPARIE